MEPQAARRRSARITGTLLVTFALGVLIGLTMGYALFRSRTGDAILPAKAELPGTPGTEMKAPSPLYAGVDALVFDESVHAARHLFIAVEGTALEPNAAAFLKKLQPGGVVLRQSNLADEAQTAALVRNIKQALGPGTGPWDLPLVAVEPESGRVDRFGSDPPVDAATLGREMDVERVTRIAESFGHACLARGISVVFAPTLDIYEGEEGLPDIAKSSFGSTQGIVTKMGLVFAEGIMAAGVIPVVKHYPGIGAARGKPGGGIPTIDRDVPGLASLMYPFAEAAGRGIPGVLVGHVAVPVLEANVGAGTPVETAGASVEDVKKRRPASLSPVLVRRVLRELWKFDGVVISADLSDSAALGGRAPEEAAVEALAAGCDAVVYLNPDARKIQALTVSIEKAVADGRLSSEDLETRVRRLEGWREWIKNPKGLVETQPESGGVRLAGNQPGETNTQPGEEPGEPSPPIADDTIKIEYVVRDGDTLEQVAAKCGVSAADIEKWNNMTESTLTPGAKLDLLVPADRSAGTQAEGLERIEHTVAAGDTLFSVAEKYGVTVLDILKWNSLGDGNVGEGQVLALYLPKKKATPPPAVPPPAVPPAEKIETTLHEVQRGENLGRIAGMYHTTQKTLLELNNLSDPNHVVIGQKLKVPKP